LNDVEAPRRPGEMLFLGDRDEMFQLPQIHDALAGEYS
jgi:hypothetical protein